jgi:hypothetical protein
MASYISDIPSSVLSHIRPDLSSDVGSTSGKLGGGFSGSNVGHWTFDREDAAVMVGDDQEERLGRVGVGHP